MKKKICIILMCIISVLCLALGIAACSIGAEFKINFVVDGQIIHTINTNGNETIALPTDPQKDGYVFDGWYLDKDVWEKPFTVNSLLEAHISENMDVYSKWRPIVQHEHAFTQQVVDDKYKAQDASCTEKAKYFYSCECGEKGMGTFVNGDLLPHTEETVTGTLAMCTTSGLTDGKKCSVCGEILQEQTVIPAGHTPKEAEIENEIKASCSAKGSYNEVVRCGVCNEIISSTPKTIEKISHTPIIVTGKDATCTETGLTDGTKCLICDEVLQAQTVIEALGHTEETINGKAATCTESGLTDGNKCSVCNEILQEQTVIPAGHTPKVAEVENEIKASCSVQGSYNEVVRCSVCNEILSSTPKTIEKLSHTEITVTGKDPTCTEIGLTDGQKCSVCGEVLQEQTVIQASGHNYSNGSCVVCGTQQAPATISEVKGGTINDFDIYMSVEHEVTEVRLSHIVTCSPQSIWKLYEDNRGQCEIVTRIASGEKGELNYGSSVFYIVVTSTDGTNVNTYRLNINRAGHTEETVVGTPATCTTSGLTDGTRCSVCGELLQAQTVIEALGHTEITITGKAATCTETGLTDEKKCSICNEILQAQAIIEALGHTEEMVAGTPATCTTSGLTDGKKCSVCGNTLVLQEVIEALGHDWDDGIVTVKPSCTNEGFKIYTCKRGCGETKVENLFIQITADKETVYKGDTVTLTIEAEPADSEYIIVADKPELVSIKGNEATFVGDITIDTSVTFSAILNADSSVKSLVSVIFKAPTIDGQVGELTSEMIEQIGNAAITLEGTLEDVYQDFQNPMNNASQKYDFKVMMEENKWYGAWNHQSSPENKIVDVYKKSDKVVTSWKDDNGNIPEGNALLKVYIDKNNHIAEKYVKNYESKHALWQNQHLWNHLGNLDVNTFEYNSENDLYVHTLDSKNENDLWIMTYLSYSLTPMLKDTLYQIAFKVEGGKIIGIFGQTENLYEYIQDENGQQKAVAMSYSYFEAIVSEVGSTVVPAPQAYEADENVEFLDAALENIRNAESYTFNAVDKTTSAPSGDAGDYEMMSTSIHDYAHMTGTVGLVGNITKDAILLAKTSKYEYVLEGDPAYRTNFSGYKQVDEGSYDYFEYSSDKAALVGKQKYFGTLANIIPSFDFSSSIFSFEGASSSKGVTYYTFALRDSSINRDVAMAMSMHGYAENSIAALDASIIIVVDNNGNLVRTSYPYSLSDVYFGTITTTFSKVNETVLPADTFDGYEQRVWESTWDSFICKYYTSNPDNTKDYPTHDENAQVAMTAVFGNKVLPTPTAFFEAFGDNWYGPFFDYTLIDTDADGNNVYKYEISITAEVVEGLDENSHIEDYDAVFAKIINAFAKEGYHKDESNSRGTEWLTLINEDTDMQIVFENIGSAFFYIDIYNLGDWNLKK